MRENEEFVREFLVESAENLDQLDRDLVALEADPRDAGRLASIFRTVHTIKGTSGFFGFSKLGAITHGGEHLLGQLRDDKIDLDDDVTGALLGLVDAVRTILDRIEKTGAEGEDDYQTLSQRLVDVSAEALKRRESGGVVVTRLVPAPALEPERAPEPIEAPPTVAAAEPIVEAVAEPAVVAPPPPAPAAEPAPTGAAAGPAPEPAAAREPGPVADRPSPGGQTPASSAAAPPAAPRKSPVAEQSIRVDVGLLGSLVDLVGELVLARNQLEATVRHPAVAGREDQSDLGRVVHRIDSVTAALQAAALKTRMQPIDQVFSKFPRIVRDLAVTCGKEVSLVIDGADTELDRSLIETIRDPLTHLVRNAIDHGIESPDTRVARGKPRAGRLSLRASHESGQVTIEIADDGGGIPVDAVRRKAVARGLVGEAEAAALPDERVLQFIFEPGFSTAAAVTDVSGRGVGMDVVRTNIEAVGGSVDLASRPGRGTTVRVRIPLTLAIIPALIVACGRHRFAIPQATVRELIALRAGRGAASVAIEGLAEAPVIRLRGRLLPLVFLGGLLGIEDAVGREDGPTRGTVVVVRVDEREFGVVVDGVTVAEEIVVKPIVAALTAVGLYAGATVRGDGAVVLILDPRGIAVAARVPSRGTEGDAVAVEDSTSGTADRYLVCESPAGRAVAVPLDDVARLEIFAPERIQRAAGKRVVHRDGGLTAIADLDAALGGPPAASGGESVTAVILAAVHGEVGLHVRRILEVVAPNRPIDRALRTRGVAGTIAVAGRATEVIDVPQVIAGLVSPSSVPA